MEWLLSLLASEPAKTVLTFFATYIAENSVDALRIAIAKEPVKTKMLECIENAFCKTCENQEWEYDNNAIAETFCMNNWGTAYGPDSIRLILEGATGQAVTDEAVDGFVENFKLQLCRDGNEELYRYMNLEHIFESKKITVEPKASECFILTGNAYILDNAAPVGRDVFIDSLCELINTGSRHIQLTGMGGIGKTEILRRLYSHYVTCRQADGFKYIGYFDYNGSIDDTLIQGLSVLHDKTDSKTVWKELRHMCESGKMLLLVDNIFQTSNDRQYMQQNDLQKLLTLKASIVLAGRMPIDHFDAMLVEYLEPKSCTELFVINYGNSVSNADTDLLLDIIKNRAGFNTLIIKRIAAIAQAYGWTIPQLARKLDEKAFKIEQGMDDSSLQDEINKLYSTNDLAVPERNILEAFSLFPPLPLPIDFCADWMCEDAGLEIDKCRLLISGLAENTWLERHRNVVTGQILFSIHQVVSAAVFNQCQPDIQNHEGLIGACIKSISLKESDAFRQVTQLIPFAQSIAKKCNGNGTGDCIRLMSEIGHYYYQAGRYFEAVEWYNRAGEMCETVNDMYPPDVAAVHSDIGLALCEVGQYDESIKRHTYALYIRTEILGPEHISVAKTCNHIGIACISKGDCSVALEWYQKALDIIDAHTAEVEDDSLDFIYNNMAVAYADTQIMEYSKSLELYQKALEIREKRYGLNHHLTASTYNNMAGLYTKLENYTMALEYYQKALDVCKSTLGHEHPHAAATYNNIGFVYLLMGQPDKALEYCFMSLTICEDGFGSQHAYTATVYTKIADIYLLKQVYSESILWARKAIDSFHAVFGGENPILGQPYYVVAQAYLGQKDYHSAIIFAQKAFSIFKDKLGDNHQYTVAALRILNKSQSILGNKQI